VFTRGVCEALLDACVASDQHAIILSEHILDEFAHHAADKFGAPKEKVDHTVDVLRANCEVVQPADVPADACRDADDLPVLGTALAGQADCLVTGDRDLLVLRTFHSIHILSPRQLYDRLIST
jgi:putative PIN family toxin of toxin-antitoxin system